jgi:phospholipid/cholesterol/gamma-HCH transport system ATP-binding protein
LGAGGEGNRVALFENKSDVRGERMARSATSVAAEPVVSFDDVHLGFDDHEVLRGLTFSVARGETKVLVGESGTGKTLAMKLAAGLLKPDAGKIRVLGHDISEMSESELLAFRTNIGFVFQEGALFDSLSVFENVAFRLREEHCGEDQIEQRVREALRFVEMEHAIELMPPDLSGGMRRRVSIARAVVTTPKLVFYDSPTAGLDPITSQTIITLILRMRDSQEVTAIVATQRLQDAFAVANFRFDAASGRVVDLRKNGANGHVIPAGGAVSGKSSATTFVFLREGRVYFEGGPQSLLDSSDPYLQGFLAPSEDKSSSAAPRN